MDDVTGGGSAVATARGGWVPRVVVRHPPRVPPPFTRGEDVFSLPPGTLKDVLNCLSTRDTGQLRLVCRDAEAHVAEHAWTDAETPVANLARWRAAFPHAVAVRLNPRTDWKVADFDYLAGLRELRMGWCEAMNSPAALARLAGIPMIQLRGCHAVYLLWLLTSDAAPGPVADAAYEALCSLSLEGVSDAEVEVLLAALTEHRQRPRVSEAVCWAVAGCFDDTKSSHDPVLRTPGLRAVVDAMRANAESAPVAAAGSTAVAALVRSTRFVNGDRDGSLATVAVLDALHAFSDHASVVKAGCSAVTALYQLSYAPDADRNAHFSTAGTLVAAAFRNHAGNAEVCAAACQAVGALDGERNWWGMTPVRPLVQRVAGGARLVVEAMRTHFKNAEVVKAGAVALADLIFHDSGSELATVSLLLDALKELDDDACACVCNALGRLAKTSTSRCEKLVQVGGVEAMLTVFDRHPESDQACWAAMKILFALADVGWIIQAMRAHLAHAAVVKAFTSALTGSSVYASGAETAALEAGAIPLLVDTLRLHMDNKDVCERACWALKEVQVADGPSREEFAQARGVEALLAVIDRNAGSFGACDAAMNVLVFFAEEKRVVEAMRVHRKHAAVAMSGAGVLSDFVFGRPDLEAAVFEAGAIPALVDALQEHANNVDVCVDACSALVKVVTTSPLRCDEVAQAGGIAAVVAVLARHLDSSEVCSAAAKFIFCLADGGAVDAVVAAGALDAVVEASWTHSVLLEETCTCLEGIAKNHPRHCQAMINARGHTLCFRALRGVQIATAPPDVSWDALLALLAASPGCADAFVEANGLESVYQCLFMDPCADRACHLLYEMLRDSDVHVPRAQEAGLFRALVSALRESIYVSDSLRAKWDERLKALCAAFPVVQKDVEEVCRM